MYLKPQYRETRAEVLQQLAGAHPLATFITAANSKIVVDHVPFVLSPDGGEFGTLRGHIPRANPVWRSLDGSVEAVAVFQGPDAYISPSWYPSKHEHGKVVPTWNYVAVHARGMPRAIEDTSWLLDHLNELTNEHEAGQKVPWKVSDAPEDFVHEMLNRLVGIEMPVLSMLGKWKLSQNRSVEDRQGVMRGLHSEGSESALAIEELVRQHIDKTK